MKKVEIDGIDHINIYSRAETELGRFLSNFAECKLTTEDGEFLSIEGYWYFLSCIQNKETDMLRKVFGNEAKKLGKTLISIYGTNISPDLDENFQRKIKLAIRYKIENSTYKQEFIDSKLPFDHYYVMYGKIIRPKEHKWVIKYIEELRKEWK